MALADAAQAWIDKNPDDPQQYTNQFLNSRTFSGSTAGYPGAILSVSPDKTIQGKIKAKIPSMSLKSREDLYE